MPTGTSLLIFSGATLLLLAVPGPAVTYIVTRSVAQGRRAGLLSVAGIHLGTVVHVLAALGHGPGRVQSSVRFGLSKFNTDEEVLYVAGRVAEAVDKLRAAGALGA